ncbi:TonB-dependent receptor [Segetibacter aerophilus]|uniref:TonB-dependent receptor n=2 Tax=Segetibacter aerophilus TaxID=670293 RepID=A0A512BGS6_9BACT|nr:TonB-dependent receptor [Segetibacter aerophilus]
MCFYSSVYAQVNRSIRVTVLNDKKVALPGSTLYLLTADSVNIRTAAANVAGTIQFTEINAGKYLVKASELGHEEGFSKLLDLEKNDSATDTIILKTKTGLLKDVTVIAKKAFVQFLPDKTVINPEANITNAGATVMDILEKSPGITVGKDGSLIMKGKPAVTVFIDGKPTQLSGAELQAYLSGMSASQVDVVELIENPGAKYDASGNAGIINIKTKANKQRGFNGSLNVSYGQGVYAKTGNTLNLNYREGKMNWFMNYSVRANTEFQNIWTLRTYFNKQRQDSALLEQPNFGKNKASGQNFKTGLDFFVSNSTTVSLVFTGNIFDRQGNFRSAINWMNPKHQVDSTINTLGENNTEFKRGGVNLSGRHQIDKNSEFSFDIDYVKFNIANDQNYQTQLLVPGSGVLATKGNTPSMLDITTLKVDYSKRFKKLLLETGLKTAINKTDNLAEYYYLDNNNWLQDLSRSNHFLYNEKISAVYASVDAEKGKWHWQTGLRYEFTSYKANQLGNAVVKDSAFNKNYGSVFPTAFVSYAADSNNMITFRTGRRIDRPPFQFLNPFLRTLNKYTYEGGNPFIKPQYTWNFALAHTYKQMLTTELSYGYLRDYFSQVFIIDSSSRNVNKNIIIYTRGNVGSFQNIGISETYQVPLNKWWNVTAAAVFNHKTIKGVVWAPITVKISQLNVSLNNQFQFKKGWGAEISGYYQTKSQIDLQEWLEPQGELNLGVSKVVLKGKGSLKLSIRDITYFQNYSGYSTFQNSYEPFKIQWDSRVARVNFSWRFGKTMKAVKRSEGGATDEINRAGSGN